MFFTLHASRSWTLFLHNSCLVRMKNLHIFFHFLSHGGSRTCLFLYLYLVIILWTSNPVSTSEDNDNTVGERKCIDMSEESSEVFLMKMNVCRKNVSITCQIGGDSMCNKDRESFRASAIVAKHLTECAFRILQYLNNQLYDLLFQV